MAQHLGASRVSRSAILFLLSETLIATTVFGGAFAAYSAPSEMAALVEEPAAGCGGGISASAAEGKLGAPMVPCALQAWTAEQDDRAYLRETASPGDTMMRQGPELAIARLHPQFVARLADAIRDARQSGLPAAGIFSAYRPPGFGIGGFGDKFKSLHAYGLAVDISGIGDPGSPEAKLWHEIAARHGVICPYGFAHRTEWNHCQATQLEKVVPGDRLRQTITADGPVTLDAMFRAGNTVIADLPAAISVAATVNNQRGSMYAETTGSAPEEVERGHEHHGRHRFAEALARAERTVKTKTKTKTKTIVMAKNEAKVLERSTHKRAEEAKTHAPHKAGRTRGEGDRDSPRRRHVV